MVVRLTPAELYHAAQAGVMRHIAALQSGRIPAHGVRADCDGWGLNIEGAAGEMAVAKALNLYWQASVNTFKLGGDVGRIQVRTRSSDDYDLIVRSDDRDSDRFVLVTGRAPVFTLRGWLEASDAKRDEFVRTYGGRPPAFFVPAARLRAIEDLRFVLQCDQVE